MNKYPSRKRPKTFLIVIIVILVVLLGIAGFAYLQLKDIVPQNAVDIGMLSVSSLLYKYFRRKEIDLYKASDYIGCMSPANVRFVLDHNDYICADRVEVAPNSIELCNKKEPLAGQENLRRKLNLLLI